MSSLVEEDTFGGGVQLPPIEQSDLYSSFLARAIQIHLDREWMPQECHVDIGNEVARIYLESVVKGGATDLNQLIMDVGTGLESYDMGDAFVGGWDVANIMSDFMLEKMGLETISCSCKIPEELLLQHGDPAPALVLTTKKVQELQILLEEDFDRYKWLTNLLLESVEWEEANLIMAIFLGYRPKAENENSNVSSAVHHDESLVDIVWRERGAGRLPNFEIDVDLIHMLDAELPTSEEDREALDDFVNQLVGEEYRKAVEAESDGYCTFMRRVMVTKWLYFKDFLTTETLV